MEPTLTERGEGIQKVLVVTFVLNAAAAAVKLLAGQASGSLALIAGGVDSLSDGSANIAGLAAVRAASRPADPDHPYGHRKFETLVSAAIAGGLFITAARLAWGALARLTEPGPEVVVTPVVLAAPVAAVLINCLTAVYENREGRRLGSELLSADAAHTIADAAASTAVLVGLLLVRQGYALFDPLVALGISVVIARVGWTLVMDASNVLADAAVLDPDEIGRLAQTVAGVEGTHKVRSRGPEDHISVDLHVQVDPALGVGKAHEIGHQVSELLVGALPGVTDVVVHIEPAMDLLGDEVTRAIHVILGHHPVQAHEVRVVRGEKVEASLHLEFAPELTLDEAHAAATFVEQDLRRQIPSIDRVVTHLEPAPIEPTTGTVLTEAGDYIGLLAELASGAGGLKEPHSVEVVRVDTELHLSAHLRADGRRSLRDVHRAADHLEALLRSRAPELARIVIHVEPSLETPDLRSPEWHEVDVP